MRLLIVRHADAGDSEEWERSGKPDSERPLSEKGRKQFKRAATRIAELVPAVQLVVSSPYTRALQTAELLLEAWPEPPKRATAESLVPDVKPDAFVRWLSAQPPTDVVAAVGHEPHLSTMATWLIAGVDGSRLTLKKAGACLISFDGRVEKGAGVLEWLMGPKQLA
jgi:phosphohistidine phosphatase